jgi:glycosyltransferase involved in cell wall biosynthesis
VLEAAACGTPSVVTRVGGLPEAVRGLDASLVVEPASPAALANRLLGPLPERAAARAFAERFGWAQVADRDLERLRAAAGGPARGKLRVVYLDHVARMSGGEIALLRLLPYLLNVEPHVILAEDGPLADALVEQGISVEVLPMPKRARATRKDDVRPGRMKLAALLGSAVYTLRIARRLRALRPDLVHTNSLKSGVYGSIAGRLAGIPVVWHVRDRIAPDYLPSPAVRMVHVLIRRLSGAVIANSQATLATLERPAHSAVVYSVVPEVIEIADRIERSGTNGPTVFGMVGRLAPWKGQDIFLDAFARAFPEGRQRAVVVGAAMFGDDERRYADALEERVRTLGLADRVEFRGFRSDVREELGRIDVLVHASRTPEPFGQVIVEGMAAGLPVLASAGGGPLELITDEVDGLLCPPGDVERLAGMLVRLDADPDLRQRLGEAARSRALDFLPEPIAERVEALYASTLRRPSNG